MRDIIRPEHDNKKYGRRTTLVKRPYECLIIGGGVTGTAQFRTLARHSNIRRAALIEDKLWVGQVNSNPWANAQTGHRGDTETNYGLVHALEVRSAAIMLCNYLDEKGDPLLFEKRNRMVLGIGKYEIEKLARRFDMLREHYPCLKFVRPDWLREHEPNVMKDRNLEELVAALVSSEGYMVNYQRLAESFLSDAKRVRPEFETHFNTRVLSVHRDGNGFALETTKGTMYTKTVEFAAGSYSLLFAQQLGYGMNYGILSVAGSFYSAGPDPDGKALLNGKVYRVQVESRPFAEIHGDPAILDPTVTRFGPTTKPLPLMERHQYRTFFDYMKLPIVSLRGFRSLAKILAHEDMLSYVAKNYLYDMPLVGSVFFLKKAKKIVPSLLRGDLKLRKGAGRIRPQIIDLPTGNLIMGDATIAENGCIFNTTPSPGASVCLANAKRDVARIIEFLGEGYYFDREGFERELEHDRPM